MSLMPDFEIGLWNAWIPVIGYGLIKISSKCQKSTEKTYYTIFLLKYLINHIR